MHLVAIQMGLLHEPSAGDGISTEMLHVFQTFTAACWLCHQQNPSFRSQLVFDRQSNKWSTQARPVILTSKQLLIVQWTITSLLVCKMSKTARQITIKLISIMYSSRWKLQQWQRRRRWQQWCRDVDDWSRVEPECENHNFINDRSSRLIVRTVELWSSQFFANLNDKLKWYAFIRRLSFNLYLVCPTTVSTGKINAMIDATAV